ncbi:hypothetical protein VPH35_007315 [Triticum aestivum]
MTRLYSTTACARRVRISCCCCLSSSTTSPPSRTWSPRAAFAAATERVPAGTLSRPDAHRLFGELLRRDTPVPSRSLNGLLPVLARSTSSAYVPRHRWARPRRRPLQPHAPSGSRPVCGASRSVHLRHPHGLLLPRASPGPWARLPRPSPQDGPQDRPGRRQQLPQVPLLRQADRRGRRRAAS